MSAVLPPWTRAAKPHPACEVRAAAPSASLLGVVADALRAQRYRVEPAGPAAFTAVRGWDLNLELAVGVVPSAGPLQHTVIDVDGLAPDAAGRGGVRLRCRDGYQQLGAAARVASQVGRAVTDLIDRGVPDVTVSDWFSDPAWERPVSDA